MAAGSVKTSLDTFTIRQDRRYPFNPSKLLWAISYTPVTENTPPVANAGPDQTTYTGQTVQLNASGSTDADGDPITYSWVFIAMPEGSAAVLSGANTVIPSFVADRFGNYVVQLIVNDGSVDSTPDTVTISTENTAPVANAGPDQTTYTGQTVQLNGSGSTDIDGNSLTYAWSLVSTPVGSTATISNPTTVNPTFVVDRFGTYVVQLIMNDGSTISGPDIVEISTLNSPPAANAGPDQTTAVGATVTLNASGSSDVDGNPLTFSWSLVSRPAGSAAIIASPTVVNPSFVADVSGTYVVQLIVNDGFVDSAPDTVAISTEITPLLDASHSVGKVIDGKGGSITAMSENGVAIQLIVPELAIVNPTEIRITPITSIDGMPWKGSLICGVQLEPEGLQFASPVELIFSIPDSFPFGKYALGFAYRGQGTRSHLYPVMKNNTTLKLSIFHFSGYGGVTINSDEDLDESQNPPPSDDTDNLEQKTAAILARAEAQGGLTDADLAALAELFDQYYQSVVLPALNAYFACVGSGNCSLEEIGALLDNVLAILKEMAMWPLPSELSSQISSLVSEMISELGQALIPMYQSWNEECAQTANCALRREEIDNILALAEIMTKLGVQVDVGAICGGLDKNVFAVDISPANPQISVGDTLQLELRTNTSGTMPVDATVAWESADPAVATVDPNSGLVTAKAEGTTTIAATACQCENCYTDTATLEVGCAPEQIALEYALAAGSWDPSDPDQSDVRSTFTTADGNIYVVAKYSGSYLRDHSVRFEWYRNGSLVFANVADYKKQECIADRWLKVSSSFSFGPVAGTNYTGSWRVHVYLDGVHSATVEFSLTCAPGQIASGEWQFHMTGTNCSNNGDCTPYNWDPVFEIILGADSLPNKFRGTIVQADGRSQIIEGVLLSEIQVAGQWSIPMYTGLTPECNWIYLGEWHGGFSGSYSCNEINASAASGNFPYFSFDACTVSGYGNFIGTISAHKVQD